MAAYALQYDGIQNYTSLGTLGNLGSNLGSGFYCKFDIKTTQTTLGEFLLYNGSVTSVMLGFNATAFETQNAGHLALWLQSDSSSHRLIGHTTNTVNFNDGNKHTIEFDANLTNNTINIIVDGVSQAITYNQQTITTTVSNFTRPLDIGARNNFGTQGNNPLACTIDNFQIGTSAGSLYGNYPMDDGPGSSTIADISGNNNTGTLAGSPLPTWVTGLNAYGNITGYFKF